MHPPVQLQLRSVYLLKRSLSSLPAQVPAYSPYEVERYCLPRGPCRCTTLTCCHDAVLTCHFSTGSRDASTCTCAREWRRIVCRFSRATFSLLCPTLRYVTSHQSPVTSHQSPVTSHQSPVTGHQSPVTSHTHCLPLCTLKRPGPVTNTGGVCFSMCRS